MEKVHRGYSLKKHNTFGIEAKAEFYAEIQSVEELHSLLRNTLLKNTPILILGEGSNVLFTEDVRGLVLHPIFNGIRILKETNSEVWVEAGAGENWDNFVAFTVSHGYGGVENLSFIPGSVGASPVQNIGAYGVEVKDVIEEVKCLDIQDFSQRIFTNAECGFDYRDSIFKQGLKGKYMINSVVYRLKKEPVFNLQYGNLAEELSHSGSIDIRKVRNAIISLRRQKLPDPKEIGNAGSFFKNPLVNNSVIQRLRGLYQNMPVYKVSEQEQKIAAGWLIEQCGWKGQRIGDAGVHKNQSLVLVNYGKATGKEILALSEKIQQSVKEKFCIGLEREVNVV